MKWNDEQLDVLAEVYKSTLKPVVVHCEDWKDRERVIKYMREKHIIVDYEIVIEEEKNGNDKD